MSAGQEEAPITAPVAERPGFSAREIRAANARELGYRFIAGVLTSIVAGAVTLLFGARTGGILLAFPAILAASLTLIEKQEDSAEAREDARGAVIGACGLLAFAVVAALTLTHLAGAVALLAATGAWLVVALGGYVAAWWR